MGFYLESDERGRMDDHSGCDKRRLGGGEGGGGRGKVRVATATRTRSPCQVFGPVIISLVNTYIQGGARVLGAATNKVNF